MKAGNLRHKVTIEYQRSDQGETGEVHVSPTWLRYAQPFANVVPLTGRELWHAQQVQPQVNMRVEVRYIAGLSPAMRVNYGGRILHIAWIADIEERHETQHLFCIEKQ